jgi:SAM-dependent methyltransferase
MTENTREPQYNVCLGLKANEGLARFGVMSNYVWKDDPRRLLFLLSRYKFVAKMLSGVPHVLEVGCGDAFGTRIVRQEVQKVTAVDFDPVFVKDAQDRMDPHWPFDCRVHDILKGPLDRAFDGAYALDVLEHIPVADEDRLMRHLVQSLNATGVLIIGMPSLQSQGYASKASREGHVNCKDHLGLKDLMTKYFHNVFIFSMNDEVVHTGFAPLAHYLIAVCCHPRTG